MRIRLIHWNASEAAAVIGLLEAAGHSVGHTGSIGSGIMKYLRADPPDAMVIDLTRQPSHGREIAVAVRTSKTIKHLPILFVDGDPEKVAAIRKVIPDGIFTTRSRLAAALKRARPVKDPVRPTPMRERFGNRTSAQKLGISAGMRVAVIDPPPDFERAIGVLPEGAALEENPREALRLTLWFTHHPDSVLARVKWMRSVAERSRLWILWRKNKGDGLDGGFIRAVGIEAGLVDYKICSVNEVWSAMAFAVKKAK